jgi:hypothetical protein
MLEFINHNLINIAVTAGVGLALGLALKSLPKLLETKVASALEALFQSGDAADDKWMIATIVWAEAKLGPGTGAAKATLVVDKILGLLPLQYRLFVSDKSREQAVALFQQSFDRVMAAAHEAETKHGAANGPA